MKKSVRAFTLDQDVGAAINSEAERIGPNKASALVNELLKEALSRRANNRLVKKTLLQVSEATSALIVFTAAIWAVLVFI